MKSVQILPRVRLLVGDVSLTDDLLQSLDTITFGSGYQSRPAARCAFSYSPGRRSAVSQPEPH